MKRRLWVRARRSGSRYVLRLHGALDGSTACQALNALAQAPGHVRELVVDLAGVTTLERFGLEVLARGAPSTARGRIVRMIGVPLAEPGPEGARIEPAPERRT